jgi:membrane-bound lytic murein transglycosylase F
VHSLRRYLLLLAGLALAVGLALLPVIRAPGPLPPPQASNELVVMVRPGPAFYFTGPDGALTGFDVELARKFATEKKLALRFTLADTAAQVLAAVANEEAHIGAGGLYRPLSLARTPTAIAPAEAGTPSTAATVPDVAWTSHVASSAPVLIYNSDGYKPANWAALNGETVAFVPDEGFAYEIHTVRIANPEIKWDALAQPSVASLISQVSDGTIGYAIVGSISASLARNIYLDFDVAFAAGGKRDIAWAVPPRFADLRKDLDAFIARLRRDGTLARLADRYMPDPRQIQRIDAGLLQEKIRTVLPQYKSMFHEAQEKSGVEWRLLAAIAYQESQWDPSATSATGVRGIMQITEDTARHLGLSNLMDPSQSVVAAARYVRDLKAKLPARIQEPDRTWLALAAFNIGLGHLEDARILAQQQKLNPDLWSDVKKVLPLLALPEYYQNAKLGYARGGMPVAFVDRVRGYYDVLLAHAAPHRPRLGTLASAGEGSAPTSVPTSVSASVSATPSVPTNTNK